MTDFFDLLDIVGRIPSVQETQAYLKSSDPDKRAKLIDSLIGSTGHTSHMFNYWADVLRLSDNVKGRLTAEAYEEWLKKQLQANTPYDQMVRNLLTTDGGVWDSGSIGFWPFEAFGFDAEFRLTPMTLRIERAATSFTQENRFPDGVRRNLSYAAIGHLLFSPIHTKLRARGDRIVHGDFVLQGGAGAILHDTVQAAAFDVGMSLYLFPTSFLSVRFDLTDRIYAQEAIGSRRITNDLVFSAGVGFWIPPRRR